MFDVRLTSQSTVGLQTSDGHKAGKGGTWRFAGGPAGSSAYVDGPFGRLGFLDIGDTHIGGDSTEEWGVLITYQGMSVVGRYDGQGTLNFTVDQFLQVALDGMDIRQVELEGLGVLVS
jgi:hypothetical protein